MQDVPAQAEAAAHRLLAELRRGPQDTPEDHNGR